jgi:diadenylate cyclase
MGALVVLGDDPEILSLCSGGFLVDAEFTPQKLYELAKMDGAMVLSADGSRLARANVHLVPDPRVATSETGTRHRTAERVARSVDVPVVTVSEELSVISVYRGERKRQLQPIPTVLARADQALSTLERYKQRLDSVIGDLSSLETRRQTTYKDVLIVLQRSEMVRRISSEIRWYLIELGADGRLIELQLNELSLDSSSDYRPVVSDFLGLCSSDDIEDIVRYLTSLSTTDLLDTKTLADGVARRAKCADLLQRERDVVDPLVIELDSKGQRVLSRIPHLPSSVQSAVLRAVGSLSELIALSESELGRVPGVGEEWAKVIRRYLSSMVA